MAQNPCRRGHDWIEPFHEDTGLLCETCGRYMDYWGEGRLIRERVESRMERLYDNGEESHGLNPFVSFQHALRTAQPYDYWATEIHCFVMNGPGDFTNTCRSSDRDGMKYWRPGVGRDLVGWFEPKRKKPLGFTTPPARS